MFDQEVVVQKAALERENRAMAQEADTLTQLPSMTKQQRARFDFLLSSISANKTKIASLRTRDEMAAIVNQAARESGLPTIELASEAEVRQNSNREEMRSFLLDGKVEQRTYAGMNVGTDANGGYLVPENFYTKITTALKATDRLFDADVVTLIESMNGNKMSLVVDDDTTNAATVVNENATSSNASPLVDRVYLDKCPTWRSGQVKVSLELLEDGAFGIDDYLANRFTTRLHRGIGAANVATLLAGSTSGVTSASASTVTVDETFDLLNTIDPAYLSSEKCRWVMSFGTLVSLLKQKSSLSGNYLIKPSTNAKGELLLHEIPVAICPSMPSVGASAKPIALGDLSRLAVRIVKGSTYLRRYSQLPGLVEQGIFGFQMFMRAQAVMLVASGADSPVKYVTCAAS